MHADVTMVSTPSGTAFAMLSPQRHALAPTLLLLAADAEGTLTTEPYRRTGRLLHARGWNVLALDLPCHGADRRADEPEQLAGWAARTTAGENFVAPFQRRAHDALAHLVATGLADPQRIAAAGTSRGGFMAFHAAAGSPLLRAVAGFAPVTDLLALLEFAGQEHNPLVHQLALPTCADVLADRATWLMIGNADDRVDTDRVIAFTRALVRAATRRSLLAQMTLHVLPTPGHSSEAAWHDEAAYWLAGVIPR